MSVYIYIRPNYITVEKKMFEKCMTYNTDITHIVIYAYFVKTSNF